MTRRPLRVLSLFDSTGTWASFAPAGAEVYAVDMQPRPLEWSRARGVVHVAGRLPDVAADLPRPDVLIMAPPCQALARQRHLAGRQGGRTGPCAPSMSTDEGLALVRWCAGASSTR